MLSQDTSVVIVDIDEEGARETATELNNEFEAEAVAVHCDVTDAESVESMVESTVDRFSEVGILVNNAGAAQIARTWEMPEEEFGRSL